MRITMLIGWNKPKTVSDSFSVLFQFYFRPATGLTEFFGSAAHPDRNDYRL